MTDLQEAWEAHLQERGYAEENLDPGQFSTMLREFTADYHRKEAEQVTTAEREEIAQRFQERADNVTQELRANTWESRRQAEMAKLRGAADDLRAEYMALPKLQNNTPTAEGRRGEIFSELGRIDAEIHRLQAPSPHLAVDEAELDQLAGTKRIEHESLLAEAQELVVAKRPLLAEKKRGEAAAVLHQAVEAEAEKKRRYFAKRGLAQGSPVDVPS